MKPVVLLTLIAPVLLLVLTGAKGQHALYKVASVESGDSFTLTDGRQVQLADVQAPSIEANDTTRPGEPLGDTSRQLLTELIEGKEVQLAPGKEPRDRYGRLVVQVYGKEGLWVQEAMLKAGMAMVHSSPESGPAINEMLALEKSARADKRGIWNEKYFQPVTAVHADQRLNRYALVEGVPLTVDEKKNGTYINFGKNYKTDFTLFIAHGDMRRFKNMPPKEWVGEKLRVRGWVYQRGGPMIDLTHPAQVEKLSI